MRKRLSKITLTNEEMVNILDVVEKSLRTTTIPALVEIAKETSGKKVLSDNLVFNSLNLHDDAALFKRLLGVVEGYLAIIPNLKSVIKDNLPESITTGSNNLNNRLALSIISEGTYFAEEVPMLLSNLINKFYTTSGTELDSAVVNHLSHRLILLAQIIPEMERADLGKVVDTIGSIPAITTLKFEERSEIPVDVVMGFFSRNFGIKDYATTTSIKRMLGYFNFMSEHKKHDDVTRNFIGNPIYHLRLFLIDLNTLRLERLKDEKRLLELRVLELQGKDESGNLKKQIAYFENKLNKLEMKIKRLSEVR